MMILRLSYILFPTILVLFALRKYRQQKWGKCKNVVELNGKVVIVTGANSGIGYEIAKELAKRKAQVILACRTMDKAINTLINIKTDLQNNSSPHLVPAELNLSSLKSIQAFVQFIKKEHPVIHILINNAGVSYPKYRKETSEDGLEIHFGVNYIAPVYLTKELLDNFAKSTDNRIVMVNSSLHERGEISLDNLNDIDQKSNKSLYANSKLALAYFAYELAKRLKVDENKNNIHVYSCCPGWVYTNLFRHSIKWYHYILIAPIAVLYMRSPLEGAQTPLFCATEPDINNESGFMYRDCKRYNTKVVFSDQISLKLWQQTEKIINNITCNI